MSRFTEQKLYIDGAYVAATSGETFQTINPVNGEVLAEVHAAGHEQGDHHPLPAAQQEAHPGEEGHQPRQ